MFVLYQKDRMNEKIQPKNLRLNLLMGYLLFTGMIVQKTNLTSVNSYLFSHSGMLRFHLPLCVISFLLVIKPEFPISINQFSLSQFFHAHISVSEFLEGVSIQRDAPFGSFQREHLIREKRRIRVLFAIKGRCNKIDRQLRLFRK